MTNQAAQTMPELPVAIASIHADGYWTTDDRRPDWKWPARQRVFSEDQMHQYARDYAAALAQTAGVADGFVAVPREPTIEMENAWDQHYGNTFRGRYRAMLAAAPSASGVHPDALPDGTLSKSTAKRLAAASVSERARELLAAEYRTHGWHEDAGRLCMGGDPASFVEDDALRVIERLIEQGDEDTHVITELGRLLAGIAVILKGPEPAGTAWSYHDLPELVASAISEPRQVAAEMKAWAHTKMAEQQSSRRDRMMVAEWAKRLLPESSFPVKDFDVEGMSITKEAAREAVKQAALEQALTQQRGSQLGDFQVAWDAVCEALNLVCPEWTNNGQTGLQSAVITIQKLAAATPQPSADAVREVPDGMVLVPREPTPEMVRAGAIVTDHVTRAIQVYSAMLSAASGEKWVG